MMQLLFLLPIWLMSAAPTEHQAAPAPPADYVMNRLSSDRIDSLVARPIARVANGDLAGGRRLFDTMLAAAAARHGQQSSQVGDLLIAFGVMLHQQGSIAEAPALQTLAGTYVQRAIPIYRAAFGPDHPEVAVALTSYADVLRIAAPDDPPIPAERAMEEAYSIRLTALGPTHVETIWTSLYLADIRSAPARVRRDPSLIQSTAAELERAAELSRASGAQAAEELPAQIHIRRARLFARHGLVREARTALSAAEGAARGDPVDRCLMLAIAANDIDELLSASGQVDGAEVSEPVTPRDVMACLEEEPMPRDARGRRAQSAMATVFSSV